ncbi:MAG: sensor domain-containing diguanylate cyclase [Gallionella sp.]|jgi:diguanylate cyclase (GGDEF)-like protein
MMLPNYYRLNSELTELASEGATYRGANSLLKETAVSRQSHAMDAALNTKQPASNATSYPAMHTTLSATVDSPTERAKLLVATRALLATLSQSLPHNDMLQSGLEALMELIQVKNGAIGVLNEQGTLTQLVCAGMSIEDSKNILTFSDEECPSSGGNTSKICGHTVKICAEELQNTRPLVFPRSLILIPISISDQDFGWICLCEKYDQSAFNEEDKELTLSLANAIALVMENARKMAAFERTHQHLTHTALHDPLTKLPNRTLLYDRLIQAINHANRHHTRLTLMFCDLDDFKTINDTLGHHAGDQVLRTIAERMASCIRVNDTLARIGGDEFIFVLSDLESDEQVETVAQKILDTISQPISFAENDIVMFGCIGIATYPFDGKDTESLMKNADSAMYTSKKNGKNNYFFAREISA